MRLIINCRKRRYIYIYIMIKKVKCILSFYLLLEFIKSTHELIDSSNNYFFEVTFSFINLLANVTIFLRLALNV